MNTTLNDRMFIDKNRNTPLVKDHTLPLTVRRYYTDIDGILIDKSLVPATLKVAYPVYVLGTFDKNGGYAVGNKMLPPINGSQYIMSYVHGIGVTFLSFTGLNNIYTRLTLGDIVHIFTDNIVNPNYFIWIVQSNNAGAIGSIIDNVETVQKDNRIGKLWVESINYFSDSITQYTEPLHIIQVDNLGTPRDNQLQPSMFQSPDQYLNDFTDIKLRFYIDQYIGIYTYLLFNTDSLNLNFRLQKSY